MRPWVPAFAGKTRVVGMEGARTAVTITRFFQHLDGAESLEPCMVDDAKGVVLKGRSG